MVDDEVVNGEIGNVYGAIEDDIEFQTIDNPYYGGEVDLASANNGDQRNNPNERDLEIITATSNIYYGL